MVSSGAPLALPPRRHFLHAAWLRFHHPVSGAQLDLRSPLPPDLVRSLVAAAGEYAPDDHSNLLETYGFYDDPG